MIHEYNELAAEFNKGSKDAFTAIYKILYHPVFIFSKNIIQSEEAADITAETFFKLYKRHKVFNTFPDIRAFLYITARNACFDYLKHQKVKAHSQREIYHLSEKEESIVIRSEIESEVIRKVKAHIKSMPSREAQVLTLAYFDGYKNAEISQLLEISDKTVRNLKATAIKKLRAAIAHRDLQNGLMTLPGVILTIYPDFFICCMVLCLYHSPLS